MAIYDNNGTTNTEIGKLYDNNGSANSQIGKVYDNNGSSNSLIYSAETYIFKEGRGMQVEYSTFKQSNHTLTLTNDSIKFYCSSDSYAYGQVATKNAINVTGLSTIHFALSTKAVNSRSYTWGVKIGISTTAPSTTEHGWWYTFAKSVEINAKSADIARTNYTLDISGLTGNYYLYIMGSAYSESYVYDLYID